MHGRILEEDGRVIGMAKLKTVKQQENPDLMLDSGDAFQGLPISNNTKGADMANAMNEVGYDAMAVGNHEFDFGVEQAQKYKEQLNFPILSANTYKDGKLMFDPYTIVNKNGINYGIIGVTTPETAVKTHPDNIKG
ncbi:bifunctional metallophosphatase/5'-nucleotidase, partial [Burkholderia multivorans]